MTDILTAADRSALMSRIRGKNTRPEYIVRSGLHRAGFRFRLHGKGIPGTVTRGARNFGVRNRAPPFGVTRSAPTDDGTPETSRRFVTHRGGYW